MGRILNVSFAVARTKEGKITNMNVYFDNMTFMAQLGLMQQPGSK